MLQGFDIADVIKSFLLVWIFNQGETLFDRNTSLTPFDPFLMSLSTKKRLDWLRVFSRESMSKPDLVHFIISWYPSCLAGPASFLCLVCSVSN